MGKRLESSLSPAVSAAPYPLNHYARHTRSKLSKFTKHVERNARLRPDSMAGTTHGEPGQSERAQSVATYAEKERKKMTHSKQTTSFLPAPDKQHNYFQLTVLVIDAEATSP